MKTKSKKYVLLITLILFVTSSNLFSQKIILNNNDTLIAFNKVESKFLLESYYKMEKFDTLLKIAEADIILKNNIIYNDSLIIKGKDTIITSYKSLFILKESENFDLKEDNTKYINKLNRNRKIILGLSTLSIILLTIILI